MNCFGGKRSKSILTKLGLLNTSGNNSKMNKSSKKDKKQLPEPVTKYTFENHILKRNVGTTCSYMQVYLL